MKAKKICALFMAVVLFFTTAFFDALDSYAEENEQVSTEVEATTEETVTEQEEITTQEVLETSSEEEYLEESEDTPVEIVEESENVEIETEDVNENVVTEEATTEEATTEETPAEENTLIVFDKIYNESITLNLDFSSCELLVKVASPDVFTKNTNVVSEYNGVYLLRFNSAEETKSAYSYYYDKVISIEVNKNAFTISSMDAEAPSAEPEDVPVPEEASADKEDVSAVTAEAPVEDVADLSALNTGNDALAEADALPDISYSGAIAVIDTGCSGANVVEAVSVLGGGVGDDNGHGTKMYTSVVNEFPGARILSIKAVSANGSAQISDIYSAIIYAIESNVSIINLSVSARKSVDSELVESAINEAISRGIIVVGSAGNYNMDASGFIPGSVRRAYIVGSCNENGERQSFSNYGSTVDYYVTSESTSEASAILSAMIARDGISGLIVNEGKLFAPDYTPSEEITTTEETTTEDATPDDATEVSPEITEDATTGDEIPEDADATLGAGEWDFPFDFFDFFVQYGEIAPDTSNSFINYAWNNSGIAHGAGYQADTPLCAYYASIVIKGFYGDKINLTSGEMAARAVNDALSASSYFKAVYTDLNCFSGVTTDAQGSSIFDAHTDAGDIVIFYNTQATDGKPYSHVGIAGGGTSLISHLYSTGWDSRIAGYYISDASVDKACTGMIVYRYVDKGYIRIAKDYDVDYYKQAPVAHDIGGASYGVYSSLSNAQNNISPLGYCYVEPSSAGTPASDNLSDVATKNIDGTGGYVPLDPGNYYIREVKAPDSGAWQLDTNVYGPFAVEAGKRTTVVKVLRNSNGDATTINLPNDRVYSTVIGPEKPVTGSMQLRKRSANSEATDGNSCYSLSGAVYGVYDSHAAAQAATNDNRGSYKYLLTTDANGDSNAVTDVPVGTYYAKELLASPGYALDSNIHTVNVTSANTTGNPATFTSYETPKLDPLSLLLTKKNDVGTPIANAEYTVKFYKGVKMDTDPALSNVPVDRTWVFKTDGNGQIRFSNNPNWFVRGDAFYYNSVNSVALPEGTVTVQETYAPAGFVLDNTIYVRQITPGENASISTFNAVTVTEETVRGDVEFKKKDENGNALANVKFSITDENGESHIVWTDANGYYSTASTFAPHTRNTNRGNAGDGVWFGPSTVDDNVGALPYGTYTVKELRCEANKNTYKDIAPITFSITTNGQVYEIGDVINYDFPTISTTAKDSITGTNLAALGDTLHGVDTVHAKNLEIGHDYKLTCKAWSKVHGEFLNISGGTKEFTATEAAMDIDVEFELAVTEELYGEDIVCFEYLTDTYYPDEVVAIHEDINDEGQTIHFPEIHTTFLDSVTNDHIALADGKLNHVDKVTYTNLIPGKKLIVQGFLHYQDTGEPVKDLEGNDVTAELTITPDKPDGEAEITFEYEASALAGRSVVAFEYLYYDGKLVASHADLTDEGQTIHFPEIHTTFLDSITNDHIALADGKLKHVDKVEYTNLIPGKKLIVQGFLHYQDTGEPVKDLEGNDVTAELTITPDKPDGEAEISFEYEASALAGRSVVAFEYLYYDGKLVASHADLTDEGQTIHYPDVHTTAKDAVSLTNEGKRRHNSTIIDTVELSNLISGYKFKVVGTVMSYDDNAEFLSNGEPVTASVELEALSEAASIDVVFENIDTMDLLGKSLVCYEKLYLIVGEQEYLVAEHADIEDKGQTVTYDCIVGYADLSFLIETGGGGARVMFAPATGDMMHPFLFFLFASSSGIGICYIARKRKKEGQKREK